MHCLVMFGLPGSGKGTQSKLLDMTHIHISTGDILRGSEDGRKFLAENPGRLAPDGMMDRLVQERVTTILATVDNFILDGYPRTIAQAQVLNEYLGAFPIILVRLNIPYALASGRMLKRGRTDDVATVILDRFKEYDNKTSPVFDYFKSVGRPCFEIDATGTPEEVSEKIKLTIKTTK